MTKEQIGSEIQIRQSLKYLTYLAMQELLLENYEDCTFLKIYDHNVYLKHKNMVNGLKRSSNHAFKFIQKNDTDQEAIKQFHNFTSIFEVLHNSIDKGGNLFIDCLNAMDDVMIKQGHKLNLDK